MSTGSADSVPALAKTLANLLGADAVITDPEELRFYSADAYSAGVTASMALRPSSRDGLAEAVGLATAAGFAINARGGGMSYTGGYIPIGEATITLDLSRLNRIVEINEDDRVLTVEAGVTWQQIYEALDPLGLRLPFFGTFSGNKATVGGGIANGALFMGTARHGTAAEIVVGLEVVTARGRIVRTGQSAFVNGRPGYRNFGPDLTGLFVHDAGALGVKTLVSLRMMQKPQAVDCASFAYANQELAVAALSDIARSGAAEEVYLFDPASTRRSLDPASLSRDLARLKAVIKNQGLKAGARMALAGRRFVDDDMYTLHFVCAGRSDVAVEADLETARNIALAAGGMEIANSIPKAARANPFEPVNGILGTDGERWAALNSKVPHSDAQRLIDATEQLLAPYRDRMGELDISMSFLYIAIGSHIFSYEPVLRWYDEWLPVHHRTPEPSYLAGITEPAPRPEARKLVEEIRAGIVALFAEFGAASTQVGKTYPLLASMNPDTRALLTALKQELDPDGLMNPGALGQFEAAS